MQGDRPQSPAEAHDGFARWDRAVFLGLVAVLPLHTLYLRFWVSWKPWMLALAVLVAADLVRGRRTRSWPWDRGLSVAAAVFLIAVAASWSGDAPDRFLRLWLALLVGALLLLVGTRRLRGRVLLDDVLRVVVWSGAAMVATGLVLAVIVGGAFGEAAVFAVNDIPGIERFTHRTYKMSGIVAVTNWHHDPGYAAAWMNLWWVLALFGIRRGVGTGRRWLDAAVIGGLWFGVIMTLSRTGLLGLLVGVAAVAWRERHALAPVLRIGVASLLASVLMLGFAWAVERPGVGNDLPTALSFRFSQGFSLGPGDPDPDDAGWTEGSWDNRSEVWPIYIEYFTEHPVRGVGLGTGWGAGGVQEPHNLALQLLGETGLVGFAGFVVLLIWVLRNARHPVGRTALVVTLAAAFTQTVLFEPTWWFAAALAAAPLQARGSPPQPAPSPADGVAA